MRVPRRERPATVDGGVPGSAVDSVFASGRGSAGTKESLTQAGDRSPSSRPTAAGTQRRLQALMARCWSLQTIAHAEGLRAPQLARALENPAVITPKLAADVSAAYDRLWNIEPPRRTQSERDVADAAGEAARIQGWAPPLAWDDDQIDKPRAEPEPGWERSSRTNMRSADLAEDAQFVRSAGGYERESLDAVAGRLGISRARLEKALSRQRSAEAGKHEREAG
jgi:hypothetical protein